MPSNWKLPEIAVKNNPTNFKSEPLIHLDWRRSPNFHLARWIRRTKRLQN